MLKITIHAEASELYDEVNNRFIETDEAIVEIELEHSLVSLAAWESKWEIPFIDTKDKTNEQTLDYIRTMCLTPDVDPIMFEKLSQKNYLDINEYISAPHSATRFYDRQSKASRMRSEKVTAELIYFWMTNYNIPFETQYWHLNNLFNLIQICNHKNQPAKKMSKSEAAAEARRLNAERRAMMNSSG